MTDTITTAVVDLDCGQWEHSLFDWYVTDEVKARTSDDAEDADDDTLWTHVHRGPLCTFRDEYVNKFVRLACLPRNDALREGMPAEHISKARIISCPANLPMTRRHQSTPSPLPSDSNS
jgi:hypothetical protein